MKKCRKCGASWGDFCRKCGATCGDFCRKCGAIRAAWWANWAYRAYSVEACGFGYFGLKVGAFENFLKIFAVI